MGRPRDLINRLKDAGTWIGVIRNLWWLLGGIAIVVIIVWRYGFRDQQYGRILLETIAIVAAFGLGALAGSYASRRRASVGDYEWEFADYTYSFDPADVLRHEQSVKIRIKANRHNVQLFKNRYSWTGGGKCKVSLAGGSHKLLTEMPRDSNWKYYYVLLDHPLGKGSTTDIEIKYDLHDAEMSFQPLIAKNVVEPLKELTLRVVFPTDMRPSKAVGAEMARSHGPDDDWQIIKERTLEVHSTRSEVVYNIKTPVTGKRYQILWSWPAYPRVV
ncbi:hypothetical protein AB0C29_01485 [Actinoplanes sp. NPDC048791]|uniref:hypothetical protein n=1 Tax=Actinoplanes sp. NPDC048791 TaxID=3154623 RepID=UPI0033EEFB68